MSCLSIFQATLSIRESAALAVNLRAASRLPAPPRRAAVCPTACSSPLLPAGRDARPGSGRPCWDGSSRGARHRPLCRMRPSCGPRGAEPAAPGPCVREQRGQSPRKPAAPQPGMWPLWSAREGHPEVPTNTGAAAVPQAPASHPRRPPRTETLSHRGEPRDRPRSRTGGEGRAGRRMAHGAKPRSGSAGSPAAAWVLHPWGSGALGRDGPSPPGASCRLPPVRGGRAALLVRH